MTENLATPQREALAPSILAPRRTPQVPVWVLAVAVVAAFVLGWLLPGGAPASDSPATDPEQTAASSPEPEAEEEDNEDDSAFVRVADRDLDDFADDLDDIDITLDEDGFWRLLTNAVELNVNVEQLLGHDAPKSIEEDWSAGLAQLEKDVDAIEAGITASSDKKVREAVADARDTIEGLLDVVARVD